MTDDIPYPGAPDPDQLAEMEPETFEEAMIDGPDQLEDDNSWYNTAPHTAANLIVRVANEREGFRDAFLSPGRIALDLLEEYDDDAYETLNTMGLSMLQGMEAERRARQFLRGGDGE